MSRATFELELKLQYLPHVLLPLSRHVTTLKFTSIKMVVSHPVRHLVSLPNTTSESHLPSLITSPAGRPISFETTEHAHEQIRFPENEISSSRQSVSITMPVPCDVTDFAAALATTTNLWVAGTIVSPTHSFRSRATNHRWFRTPTSSLYHFSMAVAEWQSVLARSS